MKETKQAKEKALVICPGRGTYTKSELGYLNKYRPRFEPFLTALDQQLEALGEPSVTDLDTAERFSLRTHTPGEYASTLIYACSAADFLAIARERYEIIAVTGNSMGWYTALWCAGALSDEAAFTLIHTMGSMMKQGVIGGQVIYPVVDAAWRLDLEKQALLDQAMRDVQGREGCEVYPSIRFGGYLIMGGNEQGLKALMSLLPPVDDNKYPFQLVNHAAFHTPMLRDISARAFAELPLDLFKRPSLPLIDGRGAIWQPYATELAELRDYTLGHQVYETYDFTAAVTVALKEFAPTKLILLGPGASTGGAIGQILAANHWLGIKDKSDFVGRQERAPYLLAMGRNEQGALVR